MVSGVGLMIICGVCVLGGTVVGCVLLLRAGLVYRGLMESEFMVLSWGMLMQILLFVNWV
jgi:hypothetical protein